MTPAPQSPPRDADHIAAADAAEEKQCDIGGAYDANEEQRDPATPDGQLQFCGICMSMVQAHRFVPASCSHMLCEDCWEAYLVSKIKQAGAPNLWQLPTPYARAHP